MTKMSCEASKITCWLHLFITLSYATSSKKEHDQWIAYTYSKSVTGGL